MKLFILPLLFISSALLAQNKPATEEIVRRIADRVIDSTSFRFVNNVSKEKFESTREKILRSHVKAESRYNKWAYVNGVLTVGMIELSKILNDKKYADYSRRNFSFIFDNIDYFKKMYDAKTKGVEWGAFFSMGNLDACGSMAAGLTDVNAIANRDDFRAYLDRAANYIPYQTTTVARWHFVKTSAT
jgi:rhamnogalacturonyl hydrolase YesR